MRYSVTLKNITLTYPQGKKLHELVSKLADRLVVFASDLPALDIVLHRSKVRAGHYEGVLKLVLPKKPIIAHEFGATVEDALYSGFHKLLKELETYKEKHFKGSSKYRSQESIRAQSWYE
jgi:hypothetical protein